MSTSWAKGGHVGKRKAEGGTAAGERGYEGMREGGMGEAMECERWGEEDEVEMDVDLSVEEESHIMSEIAHKRDTLTLQSPVTFQPMPVASGYAEMLYLVLDTNVLVSHLQFLIELKDFAIKGVGRPVLVVPWTVMQELDALKTNSSKVGGKAKQAITFLHDCFRTSHPRVRGQTMEEVQTEVDNVAIENNDDRILHCCLLYQTKVIGHGGVVVLFSNDVQLCNKALVNHVRALSRKTLLVELRVLCRSMQAAAPTSYSHTAEFESRVSQQVQKEASKEMLDDLLCEAESILRDALSAVVTVEMKLAFDNLWSTVVSVKPPWTLKDLVHILDKHWIAVFGLVMERQRHDDVLQTLIRHTKSRAKMLPTYEDVDTFLHISAFLLKSFPKRVGYKDVLTHSVAALNVLSGKLKEPSLNTCQQHKSCSVSPPIPNHLSTCTPLTPHQTTPTTLQTTPTTHHDSSTPHQSVAPPTPHQATPTSYQAIPSPQQQVSPRNDIPREGAVVGSLLPLVTLSVTEIAELTNNAPNLAEQQLPWLLNIILETTRHCLTRLAGYLVTVCSSLQRKEAAVFISRLATLLETITSSISHLLQNQMDLARLREFRASLDIFLLTCLQLSCPLSLEAVCQLVPLQLDLLVQAMGEFSSALDTLRLLAQQYSLSVSPL